MNLLKIAALVAHRHRDKSNKFDLDAFKALSTPESNEYAAERLEKLGKGSSRTVYALSSGKVLKVAAETNASKGAGAAQNEAEVDVYTNPKLKPIVAKVFDYHPGFQWIISELVRPMGSYEEFRKLAGVGVEALIDAAREWSEGSDADEEYLKKESFEDYDHEDTGDEIVVKHIQDVDVDNELLQAILALIDYGLDSSDLKNPEHWGKTADGRLVILDYGLTYDVREGYY